MSSLTDVVIQRAGLKTVTNTTVSAELQHLAWKAGSVVLCCCCTCSVQLAVALDRKQSSNKAKNHRLPDGSVKAQRV